MILYQKRPQLVTSFLAPLLCILFWHSAYCQKKPSIDTLYTIYTIDGFKGIQTTYQSLNSDNYDLGRFQLLGLGKKIRDNGNMEDALKVFLMNTKLFPKSSIPFYNYGDLVADLGDKKAAIDAYEKGLKNLEKNNTLNPNQQVFFAMQGKWGLKKLEHLNLTKKADFVYYTYHGGGMAGWWDTENIVSFKLANNIPDIQYRNFDIYSTPVPKTIDQLFNDTDKPDVSGIFNGWVYGEQVDSEEIVALDSLWENESWDRIFPESIKRAITHNGKKYLVPQAFQFNPIYYRKSVFDSLGISPPTSWNDLLTICDKIHQTGLIPFTISAKGWPPPVARWFTILNLRINGFEFHKALINGEEAWTDKRVKSVFEHWKQLFDHHAFAKGSENNSWTKGSQEFYSGKAVMYNIGEWIFENPDKDKIINDVDFFTIPIIDEAVESAEIFHLYGTLLLNKGEKKTQPNEFLKFVANKESQRHNHNMLKTRTPCNIELYDELSGLQKKQYDYIKNVEHLVPLFEFNSHPEFIEFALEKFLEFWKDQTHIDKILSELEQKKVKIFPSID